MVKTELDYILVPLGLTIMSGYHLWLLLYILRRPTMTVVGLNAINRRIWVHTMMQEPMKNGVLAVQTLRNNIMASTLMASTSIMLCSLIAVLMTNGFKQGAGGINGGGAEAEQRLAKTKLMSILSCFLAVFLLNVQSVRYYSHAGILINVPAAECQGGRRRAAPAYVASVINRGSYCWSLGLRACYFSFPLFLWLFGPIPMAACCLLMVVVLYFLDVYMYWTEEDLGEEEVQEA